MERKTVVSTSKYVVADKSGLVFLKKLDAGAGPMVTSNIDEAEMCESQLEAEMFVFGMSDQYPLSRLDTVFFYEVTTTTTVQTNYRLQRIFVTPAEIK